MQKISFFITGLLILSQSGTSDDFSGKQKGWNNQIRKYIHGQYIVLRYGVRKNEYLETCHKNNGFDFIWTNDPNFRKKGEELLERLEEAENEGLEPDDYQALKLERLLSYSYTPAADSDSLVRIYYLQTAFLIMPPMSMQVRYSPSGLTLTVQST